MPAEHALEDALARRSRRGAPGPGRIRVPSLRRRISTASSVYSGAISTSTNCSASFAANPASIFRFTATTPPYAETGSPDSALS